MPGKKSPDRRSRQEMKPGSIQAVVATAAVHLKIVADETSGDYLAAVQVVIAH
jgi:hypothetical protein